MRRPSTLLAAAFALLGCSAASAASPSAVVVTPQVRTELVVHAPDGVVPGRTIALGLLIDHQPGWHTYWKNPGDAGLPTTFAWTLPAGVSAGEIAWPTPQRVPLGPLMNYGYDGRLLLPVPISIPPGFAAEALEIALRAEWLVCKDICIPEGGEFALRVPARAASASHAAEFDAAKAAIPVTLPDAAASAEVAAGALKLRVTGLPPSWKGRELAFFPEVGGVIHNAALPRARWDGEAWLAELPLDPQRSAGPSTIPAVLTAPGAIAGVQIEVAVAGEWPAVGAAAAAPSSGAAASAGQDGAGGPAPRGRRRVRRARVAAGAAVRRRRRRAAQPDALRLPGAVAQGARVRAACR